MKRLVEIERCGDCPFFYQVNEYVNRHIRCLKNGINIEGICIGDKEKIEKQLDFWFIHCSLPIAKE
jgi:hypothetical protein